MKDEHWKYSDFFMLRFISKESLHTYKCTVRSIMAKAIVHFSRNNPHFVFSVLRLRQQKQSFWLKRLVWATMNPHIPVCSPMHSLCVSLPLSFTHTHTQNFVCNKNVLTYNVATMTKKWRAVMKEILSHGQIQMYLKKN